jgi:putative flippase GtrA
LSKPDSSPDQRVALSGADQTTVAQAGRWWWQRLRHSHSVLARAIRFCAIGLVNAAVFAGTTVIMVRVVGIAPTPASPVAYLVSAPVGFLGHRHITFLSAGHRGRQALRFATVQVINIAVTLSSMATAVDRLHLGYGWGVATAIVLVPLANFFLANFWIFRKGGTPHP